MLLELSTIIKACSKAFVKYLLIAKKQEEYHVLRMCFY